MGCGEKGGGLKKHEMCVPANHCGLRRSRNAADRRNVEVGPGGGAFEMNCAVLLRWLQAPSLKGWSALLCIIAAVGLPTALRAAVNGVVTGCEFTPYLPFVLGSAVLLRWWHAAAVPALAVAVMGGLFEASPIRLHCFESAAAIFL